MHSPAHLSGPSFPERFPRWSLERTVRTHRMAEQQRQKWHFFFFLFFSGQAGQIACLRDGKQEAHLKAFPESKWWDAVGRLVAPLSPFLSSSHRSVGGGGAPIHRSSTATSHSTSNYARAADQEIVWFLQFKEISSNWVTLYKRLNAPARRSFLTAAAQRQHLSGLHQVTVQKEENKCGFHVTGSLHEQFTCWYASHGAKWMALNIIQLTTIYSFGATLRRLDLGGGNLGSKCQLVRKYKKGIQ